MSTIKQYTDLFSTNGRIH